MASWPLSADRIRRHPQKVSGAYPVFQVSAAPLRRRHWWRWILGGVAALVVLVIAAGGAFIKLQPTPAPLALPTGSAGVTPSPLNGMWQVTSGSVAGFRVRESFLWFGSDTVGRTTAVTGTMVIGGRQVTEAAFRVDLTTITVNGKTQAQFARSLGTQADPDATITLVKPVALAPAFASGTTIRVTVRARLTMHRVSRVVTFPVSGRRDGTELQLTGAIPVDFPAWHITGPAGFGFLGSLANHGEAEFLLVLTRAG